MMAVGLFDVKAIFEHDNDFYSVESGLIPLEYDTNTSVKTQYDWHFIARGLVFSSGLDLSEEEIDLIMNDLELEVIQDDKAVFSLN